MAERVLRADIIFFDSNPMGRILTHFSKDISVVDQMISFLIPVISYGFFRALSVSIALCYVNYWMVIPLLVAVSYLVWIMKMSSIALTES